MIAPPCCPFELSPLNELKRGKLLRSITLIPYGDILMIFGIHISGQNSVSLERMVAPPCCPFKHSPLNELYREILSLNNSYTL